MIHTELERAQKKAAEAKEYFLREHRSACEALGEYCAAMATVQELTSKLHQPLLGGDVEAENKLSQLLIRESPVLTAKRSGLDVVRGWGFNMSTDIVPLVRV